MERVEEKMTKKEHYKRLSIITLILLFILMPLDYLLGRIDYLFYGNLLNPIIWFLATLTIIFYVASDVAEK